MIYKNVSYNHGELHLQNLQKRKANETVPVSEDEIWTAISFSPDPNNNSSDLDIPFLIEPPVFDSKRESFKKGFEIQSEASGILGPIWGCVLHLTYFKNPYQTNVSWAMQYGKLKKEKCWNECKKINHDIPSINFIEMEKLKSVKKEQDMKFR